MSSQRKFLLLENPIRASDKESLLCRVVSSPHAPSMRFAPHLSPEREAHNSNDIIPNLLPEPQTYTKQKDTLMQSNKGEIAAALSKLFRVNFSASETVEKTLDSAKIKQYTLENVSIHFGTLMKNAEYAEDVYQLLRESYPRQAYLVTGFLTATDSVWTSKITQNADSAAKVTVPVGEMVTPGLLPVSDLVDISGDVAKSASLGYTREKTAAEEEIIAISYFAVKLSLGFAWSKATVANRVALGPPRRVKKSELAMGGEDSDSEVEYDSGEEDVDYGAVNDAIVVDDAEEQGKTLPVIISDDLQLPDCDQRRLISL